MYVSVAMCVHCHVLTGSGTSLLAPLGGGPLLLQAQECTAVHRRGVVDDDLQAQHAHKCCVAWWSLLQPAGWPVPVCRKCVTAVDDEQS